MNYSYDQNGNLLSDGVRTYSYDDENRLIGITVPGSWQTGCTHDGFGRLRLRTEASWSGSAWVTNTTVRYLYDGMNVVQERDGSNAAKVSYLRGRDLSGRLQGAGGIGGLLARYDHGTGLNALYHTDGNGNVTALMTSAQTIGARYVYDPFGRILGQSGPLSDANVYRFSSKEFHFTSGLSYYGYRWYDPNLQRWINRDPIGEAGGINLYQFARNNPNYYIDTDGRLVAAPAVGIGVGGAVGIGAGVAVVGGAVGYGVSTGLGLDTAFANWLYPDPTTAPLPLPQRPPREKPPFHRRSQKSRLSAIIIRHAFFHLESA